jgi:hypothetical protein
LLFEADSPSTPDGGEDDGGLPEEVPRRRYVLLLYPLDRIEEKEAAKEDVGSREKDDVENDRVVVTQNAKTTLQKSSLFAVRNCCRRRRSALSSDDFMSDENSDRSNSKRLKVRSLVCSFLLVQRGGELLISQKMRSTEAVKALNWARLCDTGSFSC